MRIARTLAELAAARAGLKAPLGLVPTMGALHDGHLALVAAARRECRSAVASIFVNPLQFAPAEDLSRYPRDEDGDLDKLRDAGCDLAWLPSVATMYPPGDATTIVPAGPALGWEGAQRPGHFRGVATVVAKLFGQVGPQRAFFGEKDWQQLQVVRRVVADLRLPVEVVGVATRRDADGLALSSRNRFLSEAERRVAPLLPATLHAVAAEIAAFAGGAERRPGAAEAVLARARQSLAASGLGVDYLALVESDSLREAADLAKVPAGGLRLIAAARLGSVRLLDNVGVLPA